MQTDAVIDPQIEALEKLAGEAKLNMADVLREAEVAPSTWFRWRRKGVEPKVRTLRRVQAAIERGAAETRAAA